MLKIKIIAVGKLSTKHMRNLAEDYETRISKYAKIEVVNVKESNKKTIAEMINEEGNNIIQKIDSGSYVYALDRLGKQISSIELANQIDTLPNKGISKINFIIGGSHGLSEEVLKQSDFSLSFSKMTFPHGLFCIMLLEQVYRALAINNNSPYHK